MENSTIKYVTMGQILKQIYVERKIILLFALLGIISSIIFYTVTYDSRFFINEKLSLQFKKADVYPADKQFVNFKTSKEILRDDFTFFLESEKIINEGIKKYNLSDGKFDYYVKKNKNIVTEGVEYEINLAFSGDQKKENAKKFVKWMVSEANEVALEKYLSGRNDEILSLKKHLKESKDELLKIKEELKNFSFDEEIRHNLTTDGPLEIKDFSKMLIVFSNARYIENKAKIISSTTDQNNRIVRYIQLVEEEVNYLEEPKNKFHFLRFNEIYKVNKINLYKETLVILLFFIFFGFLATFFKIFFAKK